MRTLEPTAIIDIGSNSVRLVVFAGPPRVPTPIFNEKVLAGLGSGGEGMLPLEARARALAALSRFMLLIEHMKVKRVLAVATAAIRDAGQEGAEFVRDVKRIGFDCRVLRAEEEAALAGDGILSGIPEADGIAGDLGGGSLELVDVSDGRLKGRGISLGLGVLRLAATAEGERAARKVLRRGLKSTNIRERAKGRPLYMVGGSWRALARIDMLAADFPLPITHQYRMKAGRAKALRKLVRDVDPALAAMIAPARLATSPQAAMILQLLVDELEPSELVVSGYGIREGLLYSRLKPAVRRRDPLIDEARDAGGGEHRFGQHGDLLDAWIAPLFDDAPAMRRLRLASCLLADVAWQAHPDFRADRGIEMALHGNWVAVSPAGRVIMAQALSANFGRDELPDSRLRQLCKEEHLRRAHCWGQAMRVGQRLSGGVASVLDRTRLSAGGGAIQLVVPRGEESLAGDAVERRFVRLAELLGCEPVIASEAM